MAHKGVADAQQHRSSEHDDVVADDPCLGQRLGPVAAQVDGDAVPAQTTRDQVRQPWFVLGDQHAHPASMALRA